MPVVVEKADLEGKNVLCRVDFNVPLKNNLVQDSTRIVKAIPTIRYLLEHASRVILCSHLGRPKGKVVPDMSLKPVANKLEELIDEDLIFVESTDYEIIKKAIQEKASKNKLFMLENTRFNPGEKKNSEEYAKFLASLAEIYVSDAFGTAHRSHATTTGITQFIPGFAGFLMRDEYENITKAINDPKKPSLALIGGAKISTKLEVIENLINRVDRIALGGGIANTFLVAMDKNIGQSIYDENLVEKAIEILENAENEDIEILVPSDVRIGKSLEQPIIENNVAKVVTTDNIPDDAMILDIGPKTAARYVGKILNANTILWNGPMGVFENELYREGTILLAKEIGKRGVQTVVGGGETAYAINMLDIELPSTIHVSTGGGASLQLMAGKTLPGIKCLTGKILQEN